MNTIPVNQLFYVNDMRGLLQEFGKQTRLLKKVETFKDLERLSVKGLTAS